MKIRTLLFSLLLFAAVGCQKEDNSPPPPPVDNSGTGTTELKQENFQDTPLVIVGNQSRNYLRVFDRRLADGTVADFTPVQRDLPVIMLDTEGNEWDIWGKATAGPRFGEQLNSPDNYIGFWFAWATMYPGTEIAEGEAFTGSYEPSPPTEDWSIPTENVYSILAADAIPSVDEPQFTEYDQRSEIEAGTYFLEDDALIVAVRYNDVTRVYPHSILNWHEIVNDNIDDFYFSVSFCPITGTGVAWERTVNGEPTTFGVSGLLHNGNVIPYDRQTETYWSQMKRSGLRGSLIENEMQKVEVLETTWGTLKFVDKTPEVMTTETGFSKDYTLNPYENYIYDNSYLSYPVSFEDERLPLKERVLGIQINDRARVYRFTDFTGN